MSDCGYDSDETDCYDDVWLYIPEDDNLADDLAERTVPSPPPRDGDLDDAGYSSDYYDYWIDIEYNSDGWNDVETTPKRRKAGQHIPSQKKRKSSAVKRAETPPVLWRSTKERLEEYFRGPRLLLEDPQPSAFLRDWESRPGLDGAKDDKASVNRSHNGAKHTFAGAADGIGDMIAEDGLDPQALMHALQKNLVDIGAAPAGLDQSTLAEYALRIFSGEDDAGDVAGELADHLFGRAGDNDAAGKAIAEWTARQTGRVSGSTEASPPELETKAASSRVHTANKVSAAHHNGEAEGRKGVVPNGSIANGSHSRKRKAPPADPGHDHAPKPKKATRSYAAATASSQSKVMRVKGSSGKRG